MAKSKVNVGFRCDEPDYEKVKAIAEKENRSISNVFTILMAAGVALYEKGGWAGLTSHEVRNHE